MYINPWVFEGKDIDDKDIPQGATSFVYCITNKLNSRKYIGKKTLFFSRTKKVKGKKKKVKVPSDWKDYYGSNAALMEDCSRNTPLDFNREILRFCYGKGETSYWEAKLQFQYDVLLKDELFYNSWISCKIHRTHLKIVNIKNTT
jgi:hypothetical protein